MSQIFKIHPENPQTRLIRQTVQILEQGGVIAYPTDSGYALGCPIGDKSALQRIIAIRDLDEKHNFTLICRDLSDIGTIASFDTPVFRLLKAHTPGPYTFILQARKEIPKRLLHPKLRTIGVRIPDHPVVRALLHEWNRPLLSTTLILPGESDPLNEPIHIHQVLGKQVDLIIDAGPCGTVPTTVVDLTDEKPRILRKGRGDVTPFL
jgi:tRNA threonylcarbamoyl adenosine modification protein (Sua5/YciO/YrdC/YwlC family)